MTTIQMRMYRAEWAKCCKTIVIADGGSTTNREDDVRAAVTFKAIGRHKSSRDFSNTEFDHVMSVIWSISQADDLNLQLHQIDQPLTVIETLKRKVRAIASAARPRVVSFPGSPDYVAQVSSVYLMLGGNSRSDGRAWSRLLSSNAIFSISSLDSVLLMQVIGLGLGIPSKVFCGTLNAKSAA